MEGHTTNDLELMCLIYVAFMVGSLELLPKWWRLASLPALYGAFMIEEFYRTGGGYMGGAFTSFGLLIIWAWLSVLWLPPSIVALSRWLCRGFQESKNDDSAAQATLSSQTTVLV
jgi:hypothetical protein